jgi:hypothetical protein
MRKVKPRNATQRKANPSLRATFLEVVDSQLEMDDPPETRQTIQRLMNEGISEENAKIYIAQAVVTEVFRIMTYGEEFDADRYRRNLSRLPDPPSEEQSAY